MAMLGMRLLVWMGVALKRLDVLPRARGLFSIAVELQIKVSTESRDTLTRTFLSITLLALRVALTSRLAIKPLSVEACILLSISHKRYERSTPTYSYCFLEVIPAVSFVDLLCGCNE